ncbi:hypothetical protein BC830DRAFT_1230965 [Chytriomyces sp. MP71]|nr:hypothetical protein BC830DRAFT_1230965 [Chytriomyces sp. MP71]
MSVAAHPRMRYDELEKTRVALEQELSELHEALKSHNTNMTDSLVDASNFPRSDVDVYTVRHLRSDIIRKTNDHKALTAEIVTEMHALFAALKGGPAPSTDSASPAAPSSSAVSSAGPNSSAFALVNSVAEGSPAAEAGLAAGDRILRFGSVACASDEAPASALSRVAGAVVESVAIEVVVDRGGSHVLVSLTPRKWSGRGLLGCHLLPA